MNEIVSDLHINVHYDTATDMTYYYVFFFDEDGQRWAATPQELEFSQVAEGAQMPRFAAKTGR